jgi:hypothetical protein
VTDREGERVGVDSLRSLDGRIGGVDWRTRSAADPVVAGEADMTVTGQELLTRYLFFCMRGKVT